MARLSDLSITFSIHDLVCKALSLVYQSSALQMLLSVKHCFAEKHMAPHVALQLHNYLRIKLTTLQHVAHAWHNSNPERAKSATEPRRKRGKKTTIGAESGSSGDGWGGIHQDSRYREVGGGCLRFSAYRQGSTLQRVAPMKTMCGPQRGFTLKTRCAPAQVSLILWSISPSDWLTAKSSLRRVSLSNCQFDSKPKPQDKFLTPKLRNEGITGGHVTF